MIEDVEARALAVGKLFLGLGEPSSPERIAVYIEATRRVSPEAVMGGVELLLRTWQSFKRFPYPADLMLHARMSASTATAPAAVASGEKLVPIDFKLVRELVASMGSEKR